jgi:uncharacterized membrane protein
MIVLSYLWILALVPFLTEKEDAEVKWHAKHGLVLMAAEIAFWIAFTLLMKIIVVVTFGLGCVLVVASPLIGMAFFAIHMVAIYKGVNGQRLIIPYVTEFTEKF